MPEKTIKQYKIAIIAYWHDRRFKKKTGGLIRMFELADNLEKLGHKVVLILPKLGSPKEQTTAEVIEVPFLDLPLLRPISFHLLSLLCLLFNLKTGFDFLYTRQMNSFHPMLVAKLFGIPSIFEIPNDPTLAYASKSGLQGFIEKKIDAVAIALADRVVVLSEWSRRRLADHCRTPLEKIFVMPSGTDPELFKPLDKRECRQELALQQDCSYVGFIGSFFVFQGIDTLIDAAPEIIKKHKRVRFLLVGGGPMANSWQQQVKEMNLEDYFIFTGQVPYKNVPKYIGAMDLCVAPHHKKSNQASPVKMFDYMASARPIVASDIDVVREIIGSSSCAQLIPPENPSQLAGAISSLLADQNKYQEMAESGRRHVAEHYSRQVLTKKLLKEMRPLLSLKDD